ncbi:glycosyltransferase family 2 protein [[Phormidium] sp. ETS-05]|uniref:glycosyltransferase n=1 Tax=[Phormidium] sp. ETS-05 TaxID=222819 RepID=UPI0018EEEA09|nr:glycosyltransferase family 2 protein [[Phormidium] sp. ETS-05]
MPANSYRELEPLKYILHAVADTVSEVSLEAPVSSYPGYEGRRRKAAVVSIAVWSITIALHWVSWGFWLVAGFAGLLCIQALRVLLARPRQVVGLLNEPPLESPSAVIPESDLPTVSLLVAAKNEEAVIGTLVKMLCSQEYPLDKYEVWVIDDASTDGTYTVLERLAQEYHQLKILRRSPGATGGKSGALNQVLPLTKGDIIAVFDADAQVKPDMLCQLVPMFQPERVGAVQLRKAIANAPLNFWTKGQEVEMALDAYFQQQRIAVGGIGELRGNGQFVRRKALDSCGGWNELTITDDLDLTVRLHLDGWDVQFALSPAVQEEGVTTAIALWHQRNRWGEGGYQRYLDYWRLLLGERMGFLKSWDMFGFWVIQYFLPAAAVPDLILSAVKGQPPVMTPLTLLALTLSFVGMYTGLMRIHCQDQKPTISTRFEFVGKTLLGIVYMFHWFLIVASVSLRISVRPKRLKWVKTVHQGTSSLQF